MLAGTLDEGVKATGLLIVSGGNEIRSGAWNGQARLAARIAAQGHPTFRFDRRGVGDSEGSNGGFRTSAPDIAAAVATFRAKCPHLARIIAFGNCDAASALMLSGGAGFDALVLSNPWTIEGDDNTAPPAVLRDHYRRRLSDPRAVLRLLAGEVSIGKLAISLRDAVRPAPQASGLVHEMTTGIARYSGPVRFLIAERDRTGRAFLAAWNDKDRRIHRCLGASHSYVEPAAQEWLTAQLLEILDT